MNPSEILCVIPARGGSKRMPRKNLIPVLGRPLIVHTVEQALAAALVGRVVVSTDDSDIAEVTRATGAEVVERPKEISNDEASSEAALLHVLDTLESAQGYVPSLLVFLQCTAPVRSPSDIDEAIRTLLDEGADSLVSVVEKRLFLWTVKEGRPVPMTYRPEARQRTQDMAPLYLENGSIYVLKPQVVRETGSRLGGTIAMYCMPEASAVDIDSFDDLRLCEALMRGASR